MNKYEFNITVVTEKDFNNNDKAEIIEVIRGEVLRMKKSPLLVDSMVIVSREVTDEDIAEALREELKTK